MRSGQSRSKGDSDDRLLDLLARKHTDLEEMIKAASDLDAESYANDIRIRVRKADGKFLSCDHLAS